MTWDCRVGGERISAKMITHISKRARSSTTNYSMSNVSEHSILLLLPVFPLSKNRSIVLSIKFMSLLLLQIREVWVEARRDLEALLFRQVKSNETKSILP